MLPTASPVVLLCAATATTVCFLPSVFPRGPHAHWAYLTNCTLNASFAFHAAWLLSDVLPIPPSNVLRAAAPLVHGLCLMMALGFYVIIWPKIEKGLPAWAHARVHASHATPVALAAVHLAGVPLPPGTPGPSLAPLAASALAVAGAYCVALHADAARSKRGFVYGFLDRMSDKQRALFLSVGTGIFAIVVLCVELFMLRFR